jgi:hypothetical protein
VTTEKANDVIAYVEKNADPDLPGTTEALIALVRDLERRVAALEVKS